MNIEELTLKQLREITALFNTQTKPTDTLSGFWEPGAGYFIRTVTHHFTGRFVGFNGHELLFDDAAWIADDGRFTQAVKDGTFSEVEPYPDGSIVAIGRGSLIDAVRVGYKMPRSQK